MNLKGLMIILSLFFCIVSCSKQDKGEWQEADVVVKVYTPRLHFKSQIEPIDIVSVPAAVDGVINRLYVAPGDTVHKDQLLARIESFTLASHYRQVFSDFLEAKNQLKQAESYFAGTKTLYESDVVDKQSYMNDFARLNRAKIAFENAHHTLLQLQKLLPKRFHVTESVFNNEKDMKKWLAQPMRYLDLKAPQAGVVFVAKPYLSNVNNPPDLVGKSVKKDEAVLNVSNLSGLKLQFLIDEKTINLIKPGQKVMITLPALDDQGVLEGHIVHINAQAVASHSALAQYWASAEVSHVPESLTGQVKVGMHAHVILSLPGKKQLFVPIEAVSFEQGQAYVLRVRSKDHQREKVRIKTGTTTLREVLVEKGLVKGERIAWRQKSDD